MNPIYRTLLLLLALVAPLATAGPSAAEPRDTKADAIGRAHFQRGQKLSANGNYAAAYREFSAGYAATGRPLFLFNMGEAARASGNVAKARESYLEFLRVDPGSALAATARTRLAELDRAAGRTPPPEPPATPPPTPPPPAITTAPDGARTEPLPLLPPSATPPLSRGSSGDALPPEQFTTSPRDTEGAPLWKKWPFWAVVGGAIAGGVVVFAVTRDGADPCGTGCTQLNFR